MIQENLIDVIKDCINNKDYSTLKSRVSFEDRYEFFYNGKLINNSGNNVFDYFGDNGLFENLFTGSEAKNLIESFLDVKRRYIIILNLSDDEKIKYIEEISKNLGYIIGNFPNKQRISADKFFSTFKDKELMSKTFYENYKLFSNISSYEMLYFLEKMSSNYKMELFDKIVKDQLNGNIKVIDSFSVTSIINSFPEEQKEDVLNVLLMIPKKIESENIKEDTEVLNFKNPFERLDDISIGINNESNESVTNTYENTKEGIIDSFDISKILDCFSYENKKHILEKLYKYFKNNKQNVYIYKKDIIQKFKKEDLKDIIKIFISDYANKNKIYDYEWDIKSFCTDYSNTMSILDMTFELEKETNTKLLSGCTFYDLIQVLSLEEKLQIFNKYILEDKKIQLDEFINNITDADFKYSVLEILIVNDYFKDKTFEIVNSIIQERNFDRFADGKINHPIINRVYCEKYNLNEDNFTVMINTYGYMMIRFLDNQNIIDAINLSKENFIKYMEIFNKNNLTNADINNVCNSLLQREFRLKNPDDYNIFSTIERIITSKSNDSKQELINIMNMINEIVDIEKNLRKYNITRSEFIELLLINNTASINLLHDITNRYIALKRETYVNSRLLNINEELYLEKRIEKQFYKKTYISQIELSDIRFDICYEIPESELDDEQLKLVNNRELLSKIIMFKKEPSNHILSLEEKRSLKVFETILNILYDKQIRKKELSSENFKYSYYILPTMSEQILNIMVNINVDNLKNNVLSSDALYKRLLDTMDKYHFVGWHKTFTGLAEKADITLTDGTIAGIISYFNEIEPKLNINSNYLTSLLDYGNLYDYASMRYKYLLGNENFALIAANEGRNKASMTKHKRLEDSVSFVKKMYERKYTTIPPIDKDFCLSNNKKINVVVGNSTNMINLTYGERTEACLRIGGAFADLFDFCISDENGFHIRFTNPNTGKFVSRVSGIRNGNTLFLNELRESVDESYNNEDLIETLKEASSELINISKNSNFPIENVIITSDYALKEYEKEEKQLHLNNDKSVLYNLSFNLKINNDTGIILKTASQDNTLLPYKFSRNDVPKYECQRDRVNVFYDRTAGERMIQLHIIDGLLAGNEFENIEFNRIINCNFCISGEDWYIAKTFDNKIIKYIMPNSKNKDVALAELNVFYEKLQNSNEEEYNVGRGR